MPWYGREFYADENVLVMTLEQEGAYLRLLWNCWQEGSIPADMAKLAAICKQPVNKYASSFSIAASRFQRVIWPGIQDCFQSAPNGRLVHRKVELLRKAKEEHKVKCSEAGIRGNVKRWGGDRVPDDDPINTRTEGDRSASLADCRLPIADYRDTNPCAPDGAQGGGVLELAPQKPERTDEVKIWFDSEFWPTYPRKRAKPQGLKAARRHGKTAPVRAAIMECLRLRLPALQEQFRADGDYRPYPASWLNQTPWIDPVEAERPMVRKGGGDSVSSGIEGAMRLLDQGKQL